MQHKAMTLWWRKCTPFYGISVFLTSFLLPPGAAPCWSYCYTQSQSSYSLGRCTLASCKQARGERSQWHGQHQQTFAAQSALWLVLLWLCVSSYWSWLASDLQRHIEFSAKFSLPHILLWIFLSCFLLGWSVFTISVSMSILLCCNDCNDHGLINNSSLSFC